MTKERGSMTFDEIERDLRAEIDDAQKYVEENIVERRTKAWDRYHGRPLGNETKGRSKYMSRDVLEVVEWMLPYFIRQFMAEDKVTLDIEGQPADVGAALRKKIDQDLDAEDPGRFRMYYEWFKDALVSNTAFVKHRWETDIQTRSRTFPRLDMMQMQRLQQDPDVEVVDFTPTPDLRFADVKIRVSQALKDTYRAEALPHWEFICSRRARTMNDEHGKGQVTEVSLDYLKRINRAMSLEGEEPYFRNLDELEKKETGPHTESGAYVASQALGNERDTYRDETTMAWDDHAEPGPRQMITLTEWYDRWDVDQDGYLEDITVWFGNGWLLRWEENDEEIIPFSGLSPILDPFKFYGTSWAEIVWPLQNLKTMLTRHTLDNFEWTNSGRWRVDPSGQVDMRALMDGAPGDPVRGTKDAIEDISPQPMNAGASLGLLQYVDQLKEERGGVNKISQGKLEGGGQVQQGQMPDRGIERLMMASQSRLALVARVFAEIGFRDFYVKAAKLYQKHLKQPFTVSLYGSEITISPEQIRGRVVAQVNMPLEDAVGMQDAAKLEKIFGFLAGVNERFPGLLEPSRVHNMVAQFISSLGQANVQRFLPDQKAFMQEYQQQGKAQQQAQQEAKQFEARQLALEEMDRKIKMLEARQEAGQDRAELAQKERESIRAARQKELDSLRDYMADIAKLLQEGRTRKAQELLNIAQARQEEIKDVRDRQERERDRRAARAGANQGGRPGGGGNPQPSQNQGVSGQRA